MRHNRTWIRFLAAALLVAAVVAVAEAAPPKSSLGDPVGNYNFRVEIDGIDAGHFQSVDGISIEQEVIEYQNGDDPLTRKRPGRVKYGDITLKRGYIASTVLNDWIEAARTREGERRDVSVVLLSRDGKQEIRRWNCFECFPKSWKVSALDGKGDDVLTEEMVIVIEWFEEA